MAMTEINRAKILQQNHEVQCPHCRNTRVVAPRIQQDGTLIYECPSCCGFSTADEIRQWGVRVSIRQAVPANVAEALSGQY